MSASPSVHSYISIYSPSKIFNHLSCLLDRGDSLRAYHEYYTEKSYFFSVKVDKKVVKCKKNIIKSAKYALFKAF